MKIKVNKRQLDLLLQNMHWLNGLSLKTDGKTLRTLMTNSKVISEGRMFEVDVWFGSFNTKLMVQAHNGGEATMIARKMFPKAKVYNASRVKGNRC